MKKSLSPQIGDEVWLKPSYAIARFMGAKVAFKTRQDDAMICTIKPIKEGTLPPQVQIHLRFTGNDLWEGLRETLDIDIYVPLTEWEKIKDAYMDG